MIVAASCACVLYPHALPVRASVSAFVVAAIFSFILLRHAGLAIIAAFAPIPGLLIAHAAGVAPPLTIALCYLPGFACAVFMASEIAGSIASGIERRTACEDAFAGLALSAALAIAASAAALGVFWIVFQPSLAVVAATLGAGTTAILIVPLAATFIPFGEDFVTRFNRLREWRERMLDPLTAITEPRWGMSVGGIAIVFAVLGYFGAHPTPDARQGAIFAALLLAAFIVTFVLTREWRQAIAILIVLAVLSLIGLWGLEKIRAAHPLLSLLQTLGICAVPMVLLAVEAGRHLSEDAASAASVALLRKAPATILFFAAAAFITILQWSDAALSAVLVIVLIFGCAGALLFQPAFATALEALIPRRSTLEARYKLR